MIDIPHVEQIHLFYRARLLDLDFAPGVESLEVRLFSESDIPWKDLAFRTVSQTLRWHFEDVHASKDSGADLGPTVLRVSSINPQRG
jgi:hypothetical protein